VPAVAVARHLDGVTALRIDDPPIRYVGAVRRRDRWQSPLAAELIELLHRTAGTLDVPGAAVVPPQVL
jgi:DNA-binding transcriptional LysR family regulator